MAPIGPEDSDVRKRSDKVLKHIFFRKALAEKYDVIRGDEIDEPGMITSQVLRAVQEAPLVVADLTGHNPNVLYELDVRHAIEKPIIHVIERSYQRFHSTSQASEQSSSTSQIPTASRAPWSS